MFIGPGRVLLQGIGKRNNVSSVSGSEMATFSATGDRDQDEKGKGGCGGTSGCYVAFVTCPSMDVAKKISRCVRPTHACASTYIGIGIYYIRT